MATKRISALTAAASAAVTDQIPIEDASNATKKLTLTQVFALAASQTWSWAGTHAFGAAVTMATTLGVTGAVTLSSTLSAGASTLASLSVTGDAGVTGNLAVNTNKFNVTASNGNTAIAGTLAATGAASLGSTLAVTGASTLTGAVAMASTLGVTGIATLGAAAPTVYTSYAVGGRTEYTSTSSTRANAAFETVANPASSSSGIFTGAWGYAETKSGNAQNLTASVTAPGLIGIRGQATHAGSGTVTAATSLFAGAIASSGGGTLTNAYGLVIADQTAATNNWGVYQLGSAVRNYMAGNLGIGTTSPAYPLTAFNATNAQIGFGEAAATGTIYADLSGANFAYLTGWDGTNHTANSSSAGAIYRQSGGTHAWYATAAGLSTGDVQTLTQQASLSTTGTVTSFWVSAAPTLLTSSQAIGAMPTFTLTTNVRLAGNFQVVANPGSTSSAGYVGVGGVAASSASCAQNIGGVIGLRGMHAQAQHLGSGVVTGATGIYVPAHTNTGGGTITNAYSLYLDAQTAATTNWGVYQLGTTTANLFAGPLTLGSAAGPIIKSGSGSPEGVETAPVSSIYLRTNGVAGSLLYQKQTGTGNTGWTAIA